MSFCPRAGSEDIDAQPVPEEKKQESTSRDEAELCAAVAALATQRRRGPLRDSLSVSLPFTSSFLHLSLSRFDSGPGPALYSRLDRITGQ